MNATPRKTSTTFVALAVLFVAGTTVLGGCSTLRYLPEDPDRDLVQSPSRQSSDRLTAEEIQNYPSSISVEDLVTRHFPGLHLRGRREPGGATSVHVLGMGTPLFVVDGVPLQQSGNLGLNPRDIEYIEVLKYGAGTALYGMRGANGVIIIVTKH